MNKTRRNVQAPARRPYIHPYSLEIDFFTITIQRFDIHVCSIDTYRFETVIVTLDLFLRNVCAHVILSWGTVGQLAGIQNPLLGTTELSPAVWHGNNITPFAVRSHTTVPLAGTDIERPHTGTVVTVQHGARLCSPFQGSDSASSRSVGRYTVSGLTL
jgi:hypothetical protein